MSTAPASPTRTTPRTQDVGEGQPADALVIFGITGDLAKVMTFRSLASKG